MPRSSPPRLLAKLPEVATLGTRVVLIVSVTLTPGRCRWCGCTYHDPCPPGCGWADRAQTLCTACVAFDRLIRRAAGRREAVETFNIGRDAAQEA